MSTTAVALLGVTGTVVTALLTYLGVRLTSRASERQAAAGVESTTIAEQTDYITTLVNTLLESQQQRIADLERDKAGLAEQVDELKAQVAELTRRVNHCESREREREQLRGISQ